MASPAVGLRIPRGHLECFSLFDREIERVRSTITHDRMPAGLDLAAGVKLMPPWPTVDENRVTNDIGIIDDKKSSAIGRGLRLGRERMFIPEK